jgi:hypothetical protein
VVLPNATAQSCASTSSSLSTGAGKHPTPNNKYQTLVRWPITTERVWNSNPNYNQPFQATQHRLSNKQTKTQGITRISSSCLRKMKILSIQHGEKNKNQRKRYEDLHFLMRLGIPLGGL